MPRDDQSTGETSTNRDRYRDNDDVRDPVAPEDRNAPRTDNKFEARGDARENAGNHARNSAADPTGPEGNDDTKNRPRHDGFDDDLERDDRKARE